MNNSESRVLVIWLCLIYLILPAGYALAEKWVQGPASFAAWMEEGLQKQQSKVKFTLDSKQSQQVDLRLHEVLFPAGPDAKVYPFAVNALTLAVGEKAGRDIKFSREVLRKIYLGEIRQWNDPSLQELNPGVKFPEVDILPVFYTSEAEWEKPLREFLKIPKDKALVGVMAQTQAGALDLIRRNPGAVGFVSWGSSQQKQIPVATLVESGQGALPLGAEVFTQTASKMAPVWVKNSSAWSFRLQDPAVYPLIFLSQMEIASSSSPSPETWAVIDWIYGAGQSELEQVGFHPLPEAVLKKQRQAIARPQGK